MRIGVGVLGLALGLVGCKGSGPDPFHPDGSTSMGGDDASVDGAGSGSGSGGGSGSGSGSGSDTNLTGIGGPPVGECVEEWCWVLPAPQGDRYWSVWATSHDDIWATSFGGTMVHFDGTSWSQYGEFNQYPRGTLWGSSTNELWAALGGIYHWNGTDWVQSNPSGTGPFGQSDATHIWAVDGAGTIEFDGTTWTPHPGPGFTPIAIGGSAGTTIAVSSTGTIAQWLGTVWGTPGGTQHPGNAAVVIDKDHVVVAQNDDVAFWTSGTWVQHTPPVNASWDHITARSPTDVWISAIAQGAQYRYHWDGATWTAADDTSARGFVNAISETSSGELVTADEDGEIRVFNGTVWSSLTVGSNRVLTAWGTSPTDIWAVSTRDIAYHWDGTTWSANPLPDAVNSGAANGYYVTGIWGSAPNDYWITASRWTSFSVVNRALLHWDGTSWSAMESFGTEHGASPVGFVAVWGTGPDDIYAVGRTAVYHRDATGWSIIPALTLTNMDEPYSDIFGTGSNDVYLIQGAKLWHYGGTWTSKTMPVAPARGWINASNDVWLGSGGVGTSNVLLHYDGAFFVDLTSSIPSDHLYGIELGTAARMLFLSTTSQAEWVGGYTTTPTLGFARIAGGSQHGWTAPDGHIWAAGNGLLVHRN